MQANNIQDEIDNLFQEKGVNVKENNEATVEIEFFATVNVVRIYLTSTGPIELKATVETSVDLVMFI